MTLILLGLLYGFVDRLFGAAKPTFQGKKAVLLGAVIAGSYLIGDATTALLGLVFFVNRTLDPRIFGGDFTPTGNERVGAWLRYATVIPAGVLVAYFTHADMLKAGLAMLAWSVVATGISSYFGEQEAKAKERGENLDEGINVAVEFARGVAYGVLAGLV